MVISNHLVPPEIMLEQAAAALRDKSRGSLAFAEILSEFERRFGDIEVCLKRLDFVSTDSAYLLQPQKDGTYKPVIHNIRPGQLATALERGFLPLALADFRSAIETKEQGRTDSGERGSQVESQIVETTMKVIDDPKVKPRPFRCEICKTSTTTKRRLNTHVQKKHGDQ